MIDAQQLVVELGRRRVLDGVSVRLQRRQVLGIVGPPEAGKSVLLKTLAGLVDPSGGEITADGVRVDGLEQPERAVWQGRIGMAFQNDALFDTLSVFDNVAFPLRRRDTEPSEVEARVARRLDEVGLLDARDKLPVELSGGMRKRVGIARATVTDPELGLFDQPIAGLDPLASSRILSLIVALTSDLGMATAVVSNDLPVLLPICDRVLMLHEGRVLFDGPPDGLATSPVPEVHQFATGADDGPL